MSAHVDLSQVSWRKSSYSDANGGSCVEVSDDCTSVLPVRDSKTPEGSVLTFPRSGWNTFVTSLRNDELGDL